MSLRAKAALAGTALVAGGVAALAAVGHSQKPLTAATWPALSGSAPTLGEIIPPAPAVPSPPAPNPTASASAQRAAAIPPAPIDRVVPARRGGAPPAPSASAVVPEAPPIGSASDPCDDTFWCSKADP